MKVYFQLAECSFSFAKIRFSSESCNEMRRKVLARDNWESRFVTCLIARTLYNLRIAQLVGTPF